jgi:prepilin-type N-terminal cleavage/methylation domain-containing protein
MKISRNLQTRGGIQGFTLVEMLLSSAVSGVVLLMCFAGYVGISRMQTSSVARSNLRTEVVRLFDSLEMDMRDAKTVSAITSGSTSVLPLTLTMPQRYSSYETSADLSGDPGRSASRLQPTVSTTTGKLTFSNNITVVYAAVANGTGAQNINRTVTWTEGGVQKSAARSVCTIPSTTTVQFRGSSSTSASPSPVTGTDIAVVAKVSAPLSGARSATAAPTTMEGTIYLRQKPLK